MGTRECESRFVGEEGCQGEADYTTHLSMLYGPRRAWLKALFCTPWRIRWSGLGRLSIRNPVRVCRKHYLAYNFGLYEGDEVVFECGHRVIPYMDIGDLFWHKVVITPTECTWYDGHEGNDCDDHGHNTDAEKDEVV